MRLVVQTLITFLVALPPFWAVAEDFSPKLRFKPGEPAVGTGLVESLDGPSAVAALEDGLNGLRALLAYPEYRIEVSGFADSGECLGAACEELSRRRARDTFYWLIERGVPRERLIFKFYGVSRSLTKDSHPVNRRVELNAVIEPRPAVR